MKKKEILSKYPIKQLPPPDSRYWIRIDGRQRFSKNKSKLEKIIVDYVTGTNKTEDNATIESIFDSYLSVRKENASETTWANDIRYKRFYLESSSIYKKPLKNLLLDDAYDFFKHVKQRKAELACDHSTRVTCDLKKKYWSNVHAFMNGILEYAIKNRYCDNNPFRNLVINKDSFSPPNKTSKKDAVFSDDEEYMVCALAYKDSEKTKSSLPLGIPLLFQTALRCGELVAITWSDIDEKILHIQRELSGVVDETGLIRGRRIISRCKTASSEREIELSTDALKILKRIKVLNKENGYPTGPDDYVFYRTFKGQITTCTERCFAGRLSKYCEHSGMSVNKSPHDARRTCLTNLYKNGRSLAYIQLFAGHDSQKQTEEYLKLSIKDMTNEENTSCLNLDADKLKKCMNTEFFQAKLSKCPKGHKKK